MDLILPNSVKFRNYKGFTFNVKEVKSVGYFGGIAICSEGGKRIELRASGRTRNECGRNLEKLVDLYRKRT